MNSVMPHALLLAHRIPYPPNKGDKIRSFHWLEALATRYRVHLGTFVDDPADREHIQALSRWCTSVCARPLDARRARIRSLCALADGQPLSFGYYRDRVLARWVAGVLRAHPIASIVVFSSAMAPYVEQVRDVRRLLDFVDVDSEKWRAYAAQRRGPMGWVYAREARCLLAHERRLAAEFDVGVFVSEQERALFGARAPDSAARTRAIANGVDSAYFDPERARVDPFDGQGAHTVVFTGAMDYGANADAVAWFVNRVWPRVRDVRPQARFWIVGTRPTRAVRELAHAPGVTVTGGVPDVRPYLSHARLAIAPMRIARGLQNKVLEALSMGREIVLTTDAATGLDRLPSTCASVVDGPDEFARAVVERLARPQQARSRAAARSFAVERYGWGQQIERFLELVAGQGARPAAATRGAFSLEGLSCLRSS